MIYDSESIDLPDYKFFCFNGVPQYCQVIRDRHKKETIDFYNMSWEHHEFVGLNPLARNGDFPVECPPHLYLMKQLCRPLLEGIPFVRVDLYVVGDKVYFGEMTFYHLGGFFHFNDKKWDDLLGSWLQLPNKK